PATPPTSPLSLHDALPICLESTVAPLRLIGLDPDIVDATPLALTNVLFHQMPVKAETQIVLDMGHTASHVVLYQRAEPFFARRRSEEHTSELQSRENLVCR